MQGNALSLGRVSRSAPVKPADRMAVVALVAHVLQGRVVTTSVSGSCLASANRNAPVKHVDRIVAVPFVGNALLETIAVSRVCA